jgi:signal peptidase I
MEPTLFDGDVLLVVRAGGELARGSLVVVQPPIVKQGRGSAQIKRVVGLPRELIQFDQGSLLINGKPYPEPYLGGLPQVLGLEASRWELGPGEWFLLGDNRAHSDDSRIYGPVSAVAVEGVVVLRVWPPSRLGRLRLSS